MGTLTGETLPLEEHCNHKLPTSCRLTASPKCCACQDVRPHTDHYTIYIDGVGLVPRGTRWHRYCYFCREFWKNRVAATDPPMQPRETRIPDVPDQQPFIDKWFEFHRGYRVVFIGDNGREERQRVLREKPWKDVDPGTLPLLNETEQWMTLRQTQTAAGELQPTSAVSLDAALDELLDAANQEQNQVSSDLQSSQEQNIRPTSVEPRDLDAVELAEALSRLDEADRRFRSAQLRRQRANCELEAAEREFNQCQAQRIQAQQAKRRAQSRIDHRQNVQLSASTEDTRAEINQRAAQRFARVFGTREEIERQGPDYISPLTSMFTRAYERYRVAEDVRAAERASDQNSARHRDFLADMVRFNHPQWYSAIQEHVERDNMIDEPQRTLDDEMDNRPPPKTTQEMTIKLACKVCLQQTADTAVLPCGHLVLCSFCADICVPPRPSDYTQPLGRSQCPLCRRQVKKRAKIYTS